MEQEMGETMTEAADEHEDDGRAHHDAIGDEDFDIGTDRRDRTTRRVAIWDEWAPADDVRRLPRAMYICAKEVVKAYTPLLEPLDLTYTQYLTMLALWDARDRVVDAASVTPNHTGVASDWPTKASEPARVTLEPAGAALRSRMPPRPTPAAMTAGSGMPGPAESMEAFPTDAFPTDRTVAEAEERPVGSVRPEGSSGDSSDDPSREPSVIARSAMTLRQLGDVLYLDSGTLTPLLRKLEAKGFVSRTRSTSDARTLDVSLTDAGLRLRARTVGFSAEILRLVGLTEPEARSLFVLLRKVLANLSRR